MPSFDRQRILGRWTLRIIAALACASQAALVAITVTLATNNARSDDSIGRIALAASFLGIISLPAFISIAFLHERRASRLLRIVVGVASALLSLSAGALIIYTLIWAWNSSRTDLRAINLQTTCTFTEAGFALWVVTVASQVLIYTIVLGAHGQQSPLSDVEEGVSASPSRLGKRSTSAQSSHVAVPAPVSRSGSRSVSRSEPEPLSSAFSAYSTSPRSVTSGVRFMRYRGHSLTNLICHHRSSMIFKVIRPVTSRTKLLFHNSFVLPETNSASGSELSMRLSENSNDSESRPPSSKKRSLPRKFSISQLETIPGSRSASPANALNGPFSGHWNHPIESPRVQSPTSPSGSFKKLMRSQSRRQSNADQSHIHPLFRRDSPTPPPVALPGTVITASPHAGQVISAEQQRTLSPHRWHSSEFERPRSMLPDTEDTAVELDTRQDDEAARVDGL